MILYKITNAVNGKEYIGITSQSTRRRLMQHLADAARQKPKGCSALYRAIRKHGAPAFSIQQIGAAIDWTALLEMERGAILLYATVQPGGYNQTLGGEGTLGFRPGMTTRARMSASKLGKKQTPEWVEKRMYAHRGRVLSAEARAKISSAQKGKKHTAEHRKKNGDGNRGSRRSAETRARMSIAQRGRIISVEHRAKITATLRRRRQDKRQICLPI